MLIRSFGALLARDAYVTIRDIAGFLTQVLLQPALLLYVFGAVAVSLGYTVEGYAQVLFPGMVALTSMMTAIQGTGLPLAYDLSSFRSIEDRLFAPIPHGVVALELVLFGALRSVVTGVCMLPLGLLLLDGLKLEPGSLPAVIVAILLSGFVGASMGLALGTLVPGEHVNLVFAIVMPFVLFTGCSQYSWPSLSSIPWLQVVTLINPLTFSSELLRGLISPAIDHIPSGLSIIGLISSLLIAFFVGLYGFRRRTIK